MFEINFFGTSKKYFEVVAEKNIRSKSHTKEKLKAKRRLLKMERNKKINPGNVKSQQREVDSLTEKLKLPL